MASGGGYRNGIQRGSNLRTSSSFKSKLPPAATSNVRRSSPASVGGDSVSGRVRVAVRLRPRNAEELVADADFADCVELQPELKRLKIRKNNWDSDTYEFDELLTEFASQKRVYEVVAKPVVESVLDGYNGTVMAYGQTGTGKTFTLGRLGDEDTSARGIMVRSMEDILANLSLETDSVLVSYLQLYMETIQDLLNPSNDNIPIVEDPKTGDVSLPGATIVEIRDQQSFIELLRLGEAHRIAANTKLNTESSRSHAILMVHVKRSILEREDDVSIDNGKASPLVNTLKPPMLRKGKLIVVDLAGSERIHKSGSEGHMLEEAKSINLSLSALGKCINALAENSAHVPVRDSKLTRLLRDSFGGTARTSLIVTIGPSPRHRAETASTILFGQRAMKVENMLKIKEEFDYRSLCKRLEIQVDKLIAENERQQKSFEDEVERITLEAKRRISEAERNYAEALDRERIKCQMDYMDSIKKLEEKWTSNQQKHGNNGSIGGTYGGEQCHNCSSFFAGSEGHMLEEAKSINLSLSALGKCINALAENSAHVPVRDSKLTRLLRDSFGGTARTSLIVTIGPSPRHRAETASTILFGQRAMKVENMLKIKEEFDYRSLCKRLEIQVDKLIAENERQQKSFEDEVERITLEAKRRISEAERNYAEALDRERIKCQMDYMDSIKKLEEKWTSNQQKHGNNGSIGGTYGGEGHVASVTDDVSELKKLLQNEINSKKAAEEEINILQSKLLQFTKPEAGGNLDLLNLHKMLEDETHQKQKLEEELMILRSQLSQLTFEAGQTRSCLDRGRTGNGLTGLDSPSQIRHPLMNDGVNGDRASIANLHEQVGLQKILSLLESEDANVRIHAVKVVANLAAEEANQEKIVEAGGLTSLLMLLRSFEDETICRIAAGALANLAMNEANQELIMAQGGIGLLAMTAADAEDPQTLRMVAGAIANLCGNDKLQMRLRSEGGIRALLGMVRCRHPDVLAQVARGIANFAKCESRASTQGTKTGRSLLLEDGALSWIVQNANNEASLIRRHTELALCHLAQHEVNAKDMISGGALWELVRISRDCSREDIRALARRTLTSSPTFQTELRRLRIEM
ncbi:unnamed protein product [Ilex paraguariensis]|uniref:Protein ARMADILLO REPEAT KINESIN1 n=1 Tax=Ilex paraguariensis TaxID=185542 RepID=A0ABC8SBE7_9AQUA